MDFTKRLARWAALAGGVVLMGLVLLTVVDVCLRYVFNAPILGGRDIFQLGLVVMVAFSFAYGGATGAHVAIDFITRTGWRFLRWTDLLNKLIGVALLALLVWQSLVNAVDAYRYNEGTTLLRLPYAPFYFVLAIGFFLYFLVLLAELGSAFRNRSEQ